MTPDTPAHGRWPLVVINTTVFIIFAFSFTRPTLLVIGVRLVPFPLCWLRRLRIGPRPDSAERGCDA
jgi:hypothetical protein